MKYFLGINIGGTACSICLGDESGDMLSQASWETVEARGPGPAVARIFKEFTAFGDRRISAAGVSIGGPMDMATGIILGPPNLPGWDDVPLKDMLESRLHVPVGVAHDAAACALAEARFGKRAGSRGLAYLTCGTGFGAGLVLDGKMLQGSHGLHPEIGHWRLAEDGPVGFDRPGCAEGICSGKGLSRIAEWKFPERWADQAPDPATVVELAVEGDTDALDVVDYHTQMTGRVCAMIAELICPDFILLGSMARHIGPFWTDRVVASYEEEVLDRIGQAVGVEPASLGDRLQDLSALVVAMKAGRELNDCSPHSLL